MQAGIRISRCNAFIEGLGREKVTACLGWRPNAGMIQKGYLTGVISMRAPERYSARAHVLRTDKPAPPTHSALNARSVWIVLTLAALARLCVFVLLVSHAAVTWIYTRGLETGFVAHALLTHHGFSSPFGGQTGPTALISPGYALLVTAVFRIFGDSSNASAVVILLTQIALGVLTVWIIMRLADRLAGGNAALLAGGFFALWPTFLWVPTIFWDTSVTLCLMPGLLLLAMRLRERPSRALWLGFGALCGVTVLINLALAVIVFAIFCWCVWSVRSRRSDMILAGCLALLLYAPWPLRNARALHAFIPLRTTVGLELWMGNREGATGFVDESIFPVYNKQELARYLQLGEVGYMHEKSTAAMAAIRQHRATFVTLTAKRAVRFWFGAGTLHGSPIYTIGATLTTLLGLAGLLMLFARSDRRSAVLYALPLLLFPLPYYITHAEFRYRLAIEPELIALAAYAVALRVRTNRKDVGSVDDEFRNAAPENGVVHA